MLGKILDIIILDTFDGYWLFLFLGMCEGVTVRVIAGKFDETSGRIAVIVADGFLDGMLDIILSGAFMLFLGMFEGIINGEKVGIYDGMSGCIAVSIVDGLFGTMFDGIILVTFNGY